MMKSWLRRLERRTEYSELREIHDQIAEDARAPDDPAALVVGIEEAIRLIGRESVRDRGDLASFEEAYGEFREKERGVVGWLRRHVPFSETRRKEKERRGEVEDQQAELRANLLVVARLRLLKDGLQSESTRLLGAPTKVWEERIEKHRMRGALRDVARVAMDLNAATRAGEDFLSDVRTDVEGFGDADFGAKEDRARQASDLEAARAELGAGLLETERKRDLFQRSRERLRVSLEAVLQDQDAAYRDLTDRIQRVSIAERASEALGEHFDALHEALDSMQHRAREEAELVTDPGEVARATTQLKDRLRGAQLDVDAAERDVARTVGDVLEEEKEVAAARRALDAAQADLRTQSEQAGMVEADPSAGFDDRIVREAEAALTAAKARAGAVGEPHARAESALGRARSVLEGLEREHATLRAEEEDRMRRLAEARAAAEEADRALQSQMDGLGARLDPYLRASRRLMRLSELPRPSEALLSQSAELGERAGAALVAELDAAIERSGRLQAQLRREQMELHEEREAAARESARLFRAHAREVLGEGLLEVLTDS